MQAVLLIDLGSTYTKVTAVDLEAEKILGTAKAFTTVAFDVREGLHQALAKLESITGKLDFSKRFACSSAAGGLKMIAVGLIPDLTAEAGKRAALSAGAKVLKTFSYELTEGEAEEIGQLNPDIILLSGGTDGGNKKVILHNAKVLARIPGNFTVVVAGNKSAAREAFEILANGGKYVRICENVMPEFNVLNIEPAREVIRTVFLERIIQAKGLSKVQEQIQGPMMPTPSAVLKAASLLAVGTGNVAGIGDLMLIDVGGATTDVYSIADGKPTKEGVIEKGLPEPYAKRTVEGDLGVRISVQALVDAAGEETVRALSGLSPEAFADGLEQLHRLPETLSQGQDEIKDLDFGLAAAAVRLATERHVGRIETGYSPFGVIYAQTGKDLSQIQSVIGTGGPIIYASDPSRVLAEAKEDHPASAVLKPRNPQLLLDSHYIMAAMGLLSEYFPDQSLRILKKEIRAIP